MVGVAGDLLCPCGGTHVKNSSELGAIVITKIATKKAETKVFYQLGAGGAKPEAERLAGSSAAAKDAKPADAGALAKQLEAIRFANKRYGRGWPAAVARRGDARPLQEGRADRLTAAAGVPSTSPLPRGRFPASHSRRVCAKCITCIFQSMRRRPLLLYKMACALCPRWTRSSGTGQCPIPVRMAASSWHSSAAQTCKHRRPSIRPRLASMSFAPWSPRSAPRARVACACMRSREPQRFAATGTMCATAHWLERDGWRGWTWWVWLSQEKARNGQRDQVRPLVAVSSLTAGPAGTMGPCIVQMIAKLKKTLQFQQSRPDGDGTAAADAPAPPSDTGGKPKAKPKPKPEPEPEVGLGTAEVR